MCSILRFMKNNRMGSGDLGIKMRYLEGKE
jgi:hypothetical protein